MTYLSVSLGSGVAEVLKHLERLQDGDAREFEHIFWDKFDESKMTYQAGVGSWCLTSCSNAQINSR